MKLKRYVWAVAYSVMLVCFTLYVVLDSFVIARELPVAPQGPVTVRPSGDTTARPDTEGQDKTPDTGDRVTEDTEAPKPSEPIILDDYYCDDNIYIALEEVRYEDTNVYIADVEITSPEYLKTALAQGKYGKNITQLTSEMAAENGAIFAINGDYYGARSSGYVIRNGMLYRDEPSKYEALVIWADGSMDFVKESKVSAAELMEKGAYHVFCFGPGLIRDGKVDIDSEYEEGKHAKNNPRTAIGIIDPLHYIFVTTDGRSEESDGLTVRELAELMVEYGVQCAYNLDGGGSATMYFNGKLVNSPGEKKNIVVEREVSDIVYIGY